MKAQISLLFKRINFLLSQVDKLNADLYKLQCEKDKNEVFIQSLRRQIIQLRKR